MTNLIGAKQSSDSVNAHGGAATTAVVSIIDWLMFQEPFRFWTKDDPGSSDLSVTVRGNCTAGSCGIWDYALHASSAVKNALADGIPGSSTAYVSDNACPASVHGNIVSYTLDATPRAFLQNAIEVPISPRGNHDGLCESNEDCIYTPNFGAEQGTGDFWQTGCTFTNGTVTDVKMYAYPL